MDSTKARRRDLLAWISDVINTSVFINHLKGVKQDLQSILERIDRFDFGTFSQINTLSESNPQLTIVGFWEDDGTSVSGDAAGNDATGRFTIITPSGGVVSGGKVGIVFNKSYTAEMQICTIIPLNADAAVIMPTIYQSGYDKKDYVEFTIPGTELDVAKTYMFGYQVMGADHA